MPISKSIMTVWRFFRACDYYHLDGDNIIEASVYAKRASRNRDVETSLTAGYCEAVQ